MNDLKISNLAYGAINNLAEYEIKKILENISDPNTDQKKPRVLQIELKFIPIDRDVVKLEAIAKSKLLPTNAVETKLFLDKDNEGNVFGCEFRSEMPNQVDVDELNNVITIAGGQ